MSTQPFVGSPTQQQRLQDKADLYAAIMKAVSYGIKVGMPGIVAAVHDGGQLLDIDIAIKDQINLNNNIENIQIPRLLDVPAFVLHGGNFALTMPIADGDECWVMFADMCINQWFQNGAGVNAPQVQEILRRHEHSDAFAIVGPFSKPKQLDNISTTAAQIRNTDGTVFLGIDNAGVVMSGTPVPATSTNISASIPIKIGGVTYHIKLSTTP